jgi:hypothetical protein
VALVDVFQVSVVGIATAVALLDGKIKEGELGVVIATAEVKLNTDE